MSRDLVLLLVCLGGVALWFLVEAVRHPRVPGGEEDDGVADEV
ncbi:hypothetical protein [Streptomyces sp. NPDC091268]